MIAAGADAVIVGSAIIDRIRKSQNSKKRMLQDLHDFARSMKWICKKQ
jgi:tryptophan synthase alpha subunit